MIKRKNLEVVVLVLWCAVIFFFSNIPNLSSGLEQDFMLRKMAHMSEFFILTLLFWFVVRRKKAGQTLTILTAFFFSFDYAIFDEIHQLFIRGRSGNIFDVGIDSIGILAMALVLWIL
jgi:VanZ family protein